MKSVYEGLYQSMAVLAHYVEYKMTLNGVEKDVLFVRDVQEKFNIVGLPYNFVVYLDVFRFDDDTSYLMFMDKGTQFLRKALVNSSGMLMDDLRLEKEGPPLSDEVLVTGLEHLEILGEAHSTRRKTGGKVTFDFEPFSSECLDILIRMAGKKKMEFPLSGFRDHLSKLVEDKEGTLARFRIMKTAIHNIMASKPGKRVYTDEEETILDFDTLSERFLSWDRPLTKKDILLYTKSRHDIFGSLMMDILGMEDEPLDIDFKKRYEYFGTDSHLTPDFVYEDPVSFRNYIVDVAVTAVNPSDIALKKEITYEILASGFSKFRGKDYSATAIVMNCRTPGDLYLPDWVFVDRDRTAIQARVKELQDKIITLDNFLREMENFDSAMFEFHEEISSEELKANREHLEMFLEAYLEFQDLEDKTAADLSDSFLRGSADMDVDMTTPKEDVLVNRMKKDYAAFDDQAYFQQLMKELQAKIADKEMPVILREIMEPMNLDMKIEAIFMEEKEKRKKFLRSDKMNKFMKYPDVSRCRPNQHVEVAVGLGTMVDLTKEDGTKRYKPITLRPHRAPNVEHRAGMGLDEEKDLRDMESVIEYLTEESSSDFQKEIRTRYQGASNQFYDFCSLKAAEVAYKTSKLAKNLSYLEGRRIEAKTSYTAFKTFPEDGYSLAVHAGSRLTSQSQINYMVSTLADLGEDDIFHGFSTNCEDKSDTKWLTISSSDLKTMATMFEKAYSIACLYKDCYEEGTKMPELDAKTFFKKELVICPLIALMEMKRGTSTTAQYNRYIFTSMTAYFSHKAKCVEEISKDPVRSRVEAFIRIKQLRWAQKLDDVARATIMETMKKASSTSSDYDTLMVPSIFSNGEAVEFSTVMNDIYIGNLYQKDAGFVSHRVKAITEKMFKWEQKYLRSRCLETMNANMTVEDTFKDEDAPHRYSKDFVMLMGKEMGEKLKKNPKYELEVTKRLTDSITKAMMMTSSLESARVKTFTLNVTDKQVTSLSFLLLEDLASSFGTAVMASMVSRISLIEAVFSMFPKAQIGGPREILIQSFHMRFQVKFLENLFEGLCSLHEKEMITGGDRKEDIQSSTSMRFKKELIEARTKEKMPSVIFSLNADASKWSPSFVMSNFIYFLLGLGLPKEIEDFCISVLKSFSSKTVMLPEVLRDKWDNKPEDEEEVEQVMKDLREAGKHNAYTIKVMSGMGQGMLHKFSSLYHCAKDDVTDKILEKWTGTTNMRMSTVTLISSDDLMKQILLTNRNIPEMIKMMRVILVVYESTNMLANIHTNWKKTFLSTLLAEFNSYFSRGARASMAVIKDVFTATDTPDLTEPLHAVHSVISNISRAFRNGLYINTCVEIASVMREFVKECYCIKNDKVVQLCAMLNCTEDVLPADLGFVSTHHMLGQMLYGPNILMYSPKNSAELTDFYERTFTGVMDEARDFEMTDYISSISGKISMVLPYRADKQMHEIIAEFYRTRHITRVSVLDELDRRAFISDDSKASGTKFRMFTEAYFMGTKRNYEHNVGKHIHSIVRALQLDHSKVHIRPSSITDNMYTQLGFVNFILERDKSSHSMSIMAPYKAMMDKVLEAEAEFPKCTRSLKYRHTRRRKLMFRTKEIAMGTDKEEIIRFIAGERDKTSNRLLTVIKDMCDMVGMHYNNFLTQPVRTIKNTFRHVKWPCLSFMKLLEGYIESRINYSVYVMMSDIDKGNAVDNMVSIFCERSDPTNVKKINASENLKSFKELVVTWVSMGKKLADFPMKMVTDDVVGGPDVSHLKISESALDRAMKLLLWRMGVLDNLTSDYVFYRRFVPDQDKKSELNLYSTLGETMLLLFDHGRNMVFIKIFTMEDSIPINSHIGVMVELEILKTNCKHYQRMYYNGDDLQEDYCVNNMLIGCTVDDMMLGDEWKLSLNFSFYWPPARKEVRVPVTVMSDKYSFYMSALNSFSEDVEDDFGADFMMMYNKQMDMSALIDFLEENNLVQMNAIRKINITGDASTNPDRNQYKTLGTEFKAYSAELSCDEIMKKFSANYDSSALGTFMSNVEDVKWDTEEDIKSLEYVPLMDEELCTFLAENMQTEQLMEVRESEVHERDYMTRIISSSISSAVHSELSIDIKRMRLMFQYNRDPLNISKIWNAIASDVYLSLSRPCDWMTRIIMIYIYLQVSRTIQVPRPTDIAVMLNLHDNKDHKAFVTSLDLSAESRFISSLPI
jgi:hypothetical protein